MVRFFRLVLWPFERCAPELLLSAASLGGLLLVTGARAWSEPFWLDEVTTARLVDRGFWDIVIDRYAVAHSPLYFVLMKLWILLVSGPSGLHYPNEFWLRVPSLLAVGISGGLLAAAAWRSWGALPGLLLVPLWSLHSISGYFAVEARPYGLLYLMIALSIWANTRLRLEEKSIKLSPAKGPLGRISRLAGRSGGHDAARSGGSYGDRTINYTPTIEGGIQRIRPTLADALNSDLALRSQCCRPLFASINSEIAHCWDGRGFRVFCQFDQSCYFRDCPTK